MKSLQNQYNLIKEGKGNKEIFLKEAKAQFPQYITNVQTFDQVIHSLTEKGILSETLVFGGLAQPKTPDWFKIFNENIKAELKETDETVEEMETKGYDYKDRKNNNNISTAEILAGYYVEMKDPKNADKTESEIKAVVFKNLEKDPLYYVKDGQFGIKGLGYTEEHPGLGPTKEVTGKYKSSGMEPVKLNESKQLKEEEYKRKMLPNKVKGIADTIDIKSTLEKLAPEVWGESDFEKAKQKFIAFVSSSGMNPTSKKQMLFNLSTINNKGRLDQYLANSLLNFEKLGVKEGMISEGHGMSLRDAMNQAREESRNGYVQHVEDNGDGTFKISDWYDSDKTVASYEDGEIINDNTADYELDELDITGVAGSEEEEDVRRGVKGIKTSKHETLSEVKKRAIQKHIEEIEKMGEVAAWQHRIGMIEEKIEELTSKMTMTEGDDIKEMVDKKAVRELKKDIALLTKKKALYEKQKHKAAKRMKNKSMMETSEIVTEKEESKPMDYVQASAGFEDAFARMKNQFKKPTPKPVSPEPIKKESWSGMVRELINSKNLKLK